MLEHFHTNLIGRIHVFAILASCNSIHIVISSLSARFGISFLPKGETWHLKNSYSASIVLIGTPE